MTDIKKYTNNIRTAIYGKEVRESLATGIEVINTEVEENTKHVNETIADIKKFKNDINLAEQQRVSAENKRISDENTRVSNEEHRKETFGQIVDENSTWDSKLSNLYNNNNSELNDLKNSFKSKYDNLEAEYANDIHDIKDKYISRCPKRIDSSADLNTVTLGGNYVVAEAKNAPYNYGRLVVLSWDNAKWCTQIFYSDMRNEEFTRCSTNAEATSWTPWAKVFSSVNKPTWDDITGKPDTFTPSSHNHNDLYYTKKQSDEKYNMSNLVSTTDFSNGVTDGKHWYKLPGGLLIQHGSLPVMFYASDRKCKGYIYFPVPFASSDYTFTGNVAENNFTGYADVVCSVKSDNKARGYIEARNIDGHAPGEGKIITVNWIAIGRY
ncbi:gp53-like domain-containing protein [Paraclostridium sordellii]|uniref:gp53-like domain-containing protein n=1 Tax=Paraclostridium sordellii TaxID=1505 RepID=UPI0005DD0DFC|nr:hypothetical protein [Paeniclostridium sordellii]CEO27353.1 Uncharacterised protein [[Clostridium] sordellii] [Paeniclostridium sordellii]CEP40843.1 Uncharacterised protein [[Clostridium] sordellii] [Paeniclostridium sordellii]